jgi:hypothetical protein
MNLRDKKRALDRAHRALGSILDADIDNKQDRIAYGATLRACVKVIDDLRVVKRKARPSWKKES